MSRLLFLTPLLVASVAGGAEVKVPGRKPDKLQALILTGYNMHNWRESSETLRRLLESTGRFEVRVDEEPVGVSSATFEGYDAVILNFTNYQLKTGPTWPESTRQALLAFVRGGGGLVAFHSSLSAFAEWPEYDRVVGGAWREGAAHAPYHAYRVDLKNREHPITRGLPPSFPHSDELNQKLTMQPGIEVLATAWDDPGNCTPRKPPICGSGKDEPIMWVHPYGRGRVFTTTLGHDAKSMASPGFVATFERGAEWAATGKVTIPPPPELAAR